MPELISRFSEMIENVRASSRRVCARMETVARTVCDATETLEETICDATETVQETICDRTEEVSETVCDSWSSVPVVGGLVCAASHTTSSLVCTASHVVSKVVCTASHVVLTTVCVASHVVSAAACVAWEIVTGLLYAVLIAIVSLVGSFFEKPPQVTLVVETAQPLPVPDVQALVTEHLGRGWRVEKAWPEFDAGRDLPRLERYYVVTRATALRQNAFDLCYRLRDAAGFVSAQPDRPYTGFLGGPTL